ncbi:MAG: hypothetical protein AAB645_02045 [Patescibacteria group bacterium]
MAEYNQPISSFSPETNPSKGPLVGAVIIIILLIIGGIYVINSKQGSLDVSPTPTPTPSASEEPTPSLSSSTNLNDVEKDLGSISTADLESSLNDLNGSLGI